MITRLIYLLLFAICLSFSSCKKEEVDQPPVISITFPTQNISVFAIDTIQVQALITDDQGIQNISVYIAEESGRAMTPAVVFSPGSTSYSINFPYSYHSLDLENGIYNLVIHAEDKKQTVNQYVRLYMTGIPRKLERIFVVSGPDGSNSTLLKNDSNLFVWFATLPFEGNRVEVNYRSNQVCVCGGDGQLAAYDTEDGTMVWQTSILDAPSFSYKGNLVCRDNLIFCCDNNGYIRGFDENGTIRKSFSTNQSGYAPVNFYFMDNRLLVFCKNMHNTGGRLVTMDAENGGVLGTTPVGFDITGFTTWSGENAIVWGNQSANGIAYTYNTSIQYIYPFGTLPSGEFLDVCQTGDLQFLLCTSGGMYTISGVQSLVNPFAAGNISGFVRPESITGTIFSGENLELRAYNNAGQELESFTFSLPVRHMAFEYNK